MPAPVFGSASLRARYDDEAVIILEAIDAPPSLPFPHREIRLTKANPVITIGRTSKRNASYEATKNNAYFESAVISREHAELHLDLDRKKVFLKDVGSLHGTFLNHHVILRKGDKKALEDGDLVKFGIVIERGSDVHPPCDMAVFVQFGTEPRVENRPTVFRVPDETDVEDLSSDDEEVQVHRTSRILKENHFVPGKSDISATTSIDLTSDEQYPMSDVRVVGQNSVDHPSHKTDHKNKTASNSMDVVDLTSLEDGEMQRERNDRDIFNDFMSEIAQDSQESGNSNVAQETLHVSMSDVLGVDEGNSWSTHTPSPSPSPSDSEPSIASDVSDDGQSLSLDEEDVFEEHDEFEIGQDDLPPMQDSAELGIHDRANSGYGNPETGASDEPMIAMSGGMSTSDLPEKPANETLLTVDARSYMLNSQLPPIDNPEKLPSMSDGHFAPPAVRLPSIFDTFDNMGHPANAPAPAPVVVPDQLSAAEELGAKSGKMEYFSAREENRMNLKLSQPHSYNLPTPSAYGDVSAMSYVDGQQTAAAQALDETSQAQTPASRSPARFPGHLQAEPGVWLDGAKFLNSPPEELPEPPRYPSRPVLDETSAYQFEMSKKAATAKADMDASIQSLQQAQTAAMERSQIGIEKLSGSPVPSPPKPTGVARPSKRKASEISELTQEEKLIEMKKNAQATKPENTRPTPSTIAPETTVATTSSSAADVPRPAKRFRQVAEAFGIAALGGVAVMSALIATAPAL